MSISIKKQKGAFALSPVAAACTVMVLASSAYAQQAAPTPADAASAPAATAIQQITVTGIRRGIEAAISVKKNSESIVEAVSAEDIGKLPDISIAESIGRLPGLSAQRVAGRAQVISVRGLSPDFATSLLNGRELVSTGDNRSVEFDQYPSELLSGVVVYKTPDAGLIGQGLSGTVDMQTVRPLNFNERVIAVGARGTHNSLGSAANASANGNRFNASYIDQFNDRTLGVALGFAHSENPVQENQVGMYEPWKTDGRPGLAAGTWATDGIKALRRTGVAKRDGVMATVELKANKDWTSTLDLFHTKATQTDTANQFEVNLGNYNGGYNPGLNYTNATVNSNGTLTSATASGLYPLVRGMYNKRDDTVDAAGWNNKFKLGEATVTVDASWSKAKRNEISLENNTQLVPAPQLDTLNLLYRNDGFSQLQPGLDYSDPSKLFLRGTIYGSGYGKTPSVADELKGLKLTSTMAAPDAVKSMFADIEFGLNLSDRSKEKHQPEGVISVGAQGDTAIPADLQYSPVNLGFAGVGVIPAWDVAGAVGRYMLFNPDETSQGYLISKAWKVKEKINTAYAKGLIDTDWGGVPVRGNIGLQFQQVDQSSQANYYDGSAPDGQRVKPINDGKTYTDVLPSMNLAFSMGNDQTVRFGLAKQVARPRVDQLRAAVDFGIDTATGKPGASGGNPLLDPWRATAVDLSYEKYFGTKAYVAAAVYYKDLSTYIYTQTRDNYDFSKFIADYTPPNTCSNGNGSNQPCPPAQTTGTFTSPLNGKGGSLSGLELSASMPLDLVSPSLKGFGIVASASFNQSSIKIKDPDSASSVGSDPINLPGLSKQTYNLTAYYENNGFEFRISERKRSDFIGEIGNFNGNRTLRYVVGEDVVDAQVGYTFNSGDLKGLSLLFQVNNLTDAAYKTYAGTKDRPLEYIKWGRTYLMGANYKF